jgi:glycosyltransferase involved in cell wall biosynthesis
VWQAERLAGTGDIISVIIPAHNEGANLPDTVNCVLTRSRHPDLEVVVVDDSSSDGSTQRLIQRFRADKRVRLVQASNLGVAGARNCGAAEACGDIFVFMDGHCYTPPGWLPQLTAPLADPEVGMIGPAFASLQHGNGARGMGVRWLGPDLSYEWLPQQGELPYAVPLIPGGCQAIRRSLFEALGGYDDGMTRWGSEDVEISLRVWLMGYQVLMHPQVVIYHLFRKTFPYAVDKAGVIHNRLRLAMLHLSEYRLAKVIDCYRQDPDFSRSLIMLFEGDAIQRRRELFERRVRDDDWYFSRFACPI